MEPWMLPVGLALGLGGALVLAVADAWLSRSILIYLDAVEANVTTMVQALRAGSTCVIVTTIDVKRDRSQNIARGLKTVGWLAMAAAFGLQLTVAYLTRHPQ